MGTADLTSGFPRSVSLGARAVGWIEVEEWIAGQIKDSREIRAHKTGMNPSPSR